MITALYIATASVICFCLGIIFATANSKRSEMAKAYEAMAASAPPSAPPVPAKPPAQLYYMHCMNCGVNYEFERGDCPCCRSSNAVQQLKGF